MAEMVYAVHTRTCTYLLDEEGVCGWVTSPSGSAEQDRCVGAQFVACLDLREEGGLVGELRVGAAGLFARRESGRFVLLKTSEIERVEYRRAGAYLQQGGATLTPPDPHVAMPTPGHAADPETLRLPRGAPVNHAYPAYPAPAPPAPPVYPAEAPSWPAAQSFATRTQTSPAAYPPTSPDEYPYPGSTTSPDAEPISLNSADEYPEPVSLDMEELSTYTGEVTLNLPLYRPDHQDPSLPWDTAAPPAPPAPSAPPAPHPYPGPRDDGRRRR